jgi:hypothetical protein
MEIIELFTSAPPFLKALMPLQAGVVIWAFWMLFKLHRDEAKKSKK